MYKHLLAATDGSDLAGKAVLHAAQLARECEAKLTIVVVTDSWPVLEVAQKAVERKTDAIAEFEQHASSWAEGVLANAVRSAEGAGVRAQTMHVADARPAQGILDAAEKLGCDAIVMSTHGRRGLRRMVLGSQAADVIADAKVPVIVVK